MKVYIISVVYDLKFYNKYISILLHRNLQLFRRNFHPSDCIISFFLNFEFYFILTCSLNINVMTYIITKWDTLLGRSMLYFNNLKSNKAVHT